MAAVKKVYNVRDIDPDAFDFFSYKEHAKDAWAKKVEGDPYMLTSEGGEYPGTASDFSKTCWSSYNRFHNAWMKEIESFIKEGRSNDMEADANALLRLDGEIYFLLPKEYQTKDRRIAILADDGFLIARLDQSELTEEEMLAAVNENGYAISCIENPTERVAQTAVRAYAPCIKFIPEEFRSKELDDMAVMQNPLAVLPDMDREVVMKAVQQYPAVAEEIPDFEKSFPDVAEWLAGAFPDYLEEAKYVSPEMLIAAMRTKPDAYLFVREECRTPDLLDAAGTAFPDQADQMADLWPDDETVHSMSREERMQLAADAAKRNVKDEPQSEQNGTEYA